MRVIKKVLKWAAVGGSLGLVYGLGVKNGTDNFYKPYKKGKK